MFQAIRGRFTFSKWILGILTVFLFPLAVFFGLLILGVSFSNLETFFGSFFGTFLGFVVALSLDMRREERARSEKVAEEKEEFKKSIDLIKREIADNRILAKKMSEYLGWVDSGADQDSWSRERELLFYRLQTSSKESVWHRLLEGVTDLELIADIDVLYMDIICCNNLLEQFTRVIGNSLRMGSMIQDYKTALAANPWKIKLSNLLVRIAKNCDEAEKSLNKIREANP